MPTTSRAKGRSGGRRADGTDRARRARAAELAAADEARRALGRAATARDEAWRSAEAASRRRVRTVLAVPFVPGIVLAALGALYLPLIFVGVGLILLWGIAAALLSQAARAGFSKRLSGLPPREAVARGHISAAEEARFEDVTESLCALLGLSSPSLLVLVDDAPNAVSTGARPGLVTLAVTSGLLRRLERIEVEAVIAHELAHMKRGDTLSGGLAAALRRRLGFAGAVTRHLACYVEGAERELEADLAAVQATRYPPGLVAALQSSEDAVARGQSVPPESETQWLVSRSSSREQGDDGGFGLAERLEVLVEL